MEATHRPFLRTLAGALLSAATLAVAAPGDQLVPPLTAAQRAGTSPQQATKSKLTSLPARGLFKGDQLSDSAKSRLTDLIIDALGMDVQVALIVPTGPWQIDGGGSSERDLTPARLAALRKFLTERGVEPKRIFVESRTDAKVTEPRLDVELVGQPATN